MNTTLKYHARCVLLRETAGTCRWADGNKNSVLTLNYSVSHDIRKSALINSYKKSYVIKHHVFPDVKNKNKVLSIHRYEITRPIISLNMTRVT